MSKKTSVNDLISRLNSAEDGIEPILLNGITGAFGRTAAGEAINRLARNTSLQAAGRAFDLIDEDDAAVKSFVYTFRTKLVTRDQYDLAMEVIERLQDQNAALRTDGERKQSRIAELLPYKTRANTAEQRLNKTKRGNDALLSFLETEAGADIKKMVLDRMRLASDNLRVLDEQREQTEKQLAGDARILSAFEG